MVRRKQRRRRASDDDIDPMAGTTNLVDAMLVLALGFLIFVVISWNMQSVIFSDMSQDQKQAVMESMKQVSEVTQGQELNDLKVLDKVSLSWEKSIKIHRQGS